jgi:GGDEF domain-containing protein
LEVTRVKRLGNPLSMFSHAADRGTAAAYYDSLTDLPNRRMYEDRL